MIAEMLHHVIPLRHFSEYPPDGLCFEDALPVESSKRTEPSLISKWRIHVLHAKKPNPKWVSGNDIPERAIRVRRSLRS
jgi:hypothetical protein